MPKSIVSEVRAELKAAGAVKTDADFCKRWLGRSECYLRTLRYTGGWPSASALARCADRLEKLAAHLLEKMGEVEIYWAKRFLALASNCRAEMSVRLLEGSPRATVDILQSQAAEYFPNGGGSVVTPQVSGEPRADR